MKRFLRSCSIVLILALFLAGCAGQPSVVQSSASVQTQAAAVPEAPAKAPAETLVKAPPAPAGKPIELTILHVNDTHSKLEASSVAFKLDITDALKGKAVYAELGGFPRLISAVESVRASKKNTLFLHAGDAFQGTLYFTQFNGKAEVDFLNDLKLDAMVPGNHEFDKGPALLRSALLDAANFPVVSANLDYSSDANLKGADILPFVVKDVSGEKVGIIGISNPETPFISSPGPNVRFTDAKAAVEKSVAELENLGVNKIVVLSHEGYELDVALAKAVKGVDVFVGGHSHTLLGDTASVGLTSLGKYPTVVTTASGETALVVQAWQWAHVLGMLDVSFDAAGKITGYTGSPKFIVGTSWARIYDLPGADGKNVRVEFRKSAEGKWNVKEYEGGAYKVDPPANRVAAHLAALSALGGKFAADPRVLAVTDNKAAAAKLAGYSKGVNELKARVACEAAEDLKRVNNAGPGPLVADSMLWKTGADVSVMNPGGVRVNLNAGTVSVAQVYELQPFGNTLVTLDITGADLVKVLEDMSDFCITSYTQAPDTANIYVSGMTLTLNVKAARGSRVTDVKVGKPGAWVALDPAKKYKLVVNNFMGTGGDKNDTLKKLVPAQYDTGFVDSEVMLEYLQGKNIRNTGEVRVNQVF